MAQYSGFFNATEISPGQYDNVYDAADFAFLFELFFGNGVFVDPANQLMVQAKSGLAVTVQPGAAFIDGYWYRLTEPMDVEFPADGQGTYSVVLQFDGEKIEIPPNAVLQSEKIETVMLTSYVLAQVNMTGGMTNITNANITDRRGQTNYCGFVSSTIKQIDTTDLFLQFQTAFDEFMATIEGALGDDVAGNLLNKITKTQAMIAEPYDEGTQYNANDYVIYQDVLKKCIASTTGTYDQTKWTDASVVEDLSYIAQSFQDGCSVIAAAITSMGVPTAENASPEQMAANIQLIMPELTGNAGTAQVLSGYTFYSNNPKSKQTGTMTNRGAITGSVNAGGTYTIPKGYHNGSGKVTGNSLSSQTSASATAAQILSGYTAWVNGSKITGSMPNRGALNWSGSNTTYSVAAGWYSGGTLDSRPSYNNGYNAGVSAGKQAAYSSKTFTATSNASGDLSAVRYIPQDILSSNTGASTNCPYVSFNTGVTKVIAIRTAISGGISAICHWYAAYPSRVISICSHSGSGFEIGDVRTNSSSNFWVNGTNARLPLYPDQDSTIHSKTVTITMWYY